MIFIWLLVWALEGAPHFMLWSAWFWTLVISIILL